MISAIVATDEKQGIGKDGKIPWKIPGEQLRLKEITTPHPVIMGRKTFESIPDRFRPLVGRPNIVITRNTKLDTQENVHIVHSIDAALEHAKKLDQDEIFILGGAEIFKETLSLVDRLYITVIQGDYDADTFFPEYSEFSKIVSQEKHEQDGLPFEYLILERPSR